MPVCYNFLRMEDPMLDGAPLRDGDELELYLMDGEWLPARFTREGGLSIVWFGHSSAMRFDVALRIGVRRRQSG
jgi:hypothetical protein